VAAPEIWNCPAAVRYGGGMSSTAKRFPISFDGWYRALSISLGVPPSESYVDVDDETVEVRMGWLFEARFPRAAVASTSMWNQRTISRGVHGFGGTWLVNGSGRGILSMDLADGQHASLHLKVLWFRLLTFSVRLKALLVSVEDPAALATALAPAKVLACR
jgi:hypothetical protein